MAIFPLYSKRQKQLRGEVPDVYVYDTFPNPFRVQVVHIWQDALGNHAEYHDQYRQVFSTYESIVQTLCREYGVFSLQERTYGWDHVQELANYFLEATDPEKILDIIELTFNCIDTFTRSYSYLHRSDADQRANDAIEELNQRFKEHGLGYQYCDSEIIRVDSEFVHAEIVKPALALLHGSEFSGAQAEFLKAHEHYRHGRQKEALTECSKALESTMKSICDKRRWPYDKHRDTSQKLIQICFDRGLIPQFWLNQFTALRSTLESGAPTGRNKLGAHGQGASVVEVPSHLTAYALHMSAAAIVFLVEAERNMS
jgi:AbiJ N-terminal domain 4